MSPEWITAIVSGIVSLAGAVFLYIKRRDDQEDPIPKAVVEATVAEQITGAAAVLIAGLAAEIKRVSDECAELRGEHKNAVAAIESLREKADRAAALSAKALAYIADVTEWDKSGRVGPLPKLPVELHRVIIGEAD